MLQTPESAPAAPATGCFAVAWFVSLAFDCAGFLSGDRRFYYVGFALIGLALPVVTVAALVGAWAGRRESPSPAAAGATGGRVLVRVISPLSPGVWRVTVGVEVGRLDGGVEQDWPEAHVPAAARHPNGEFAIAGVIDGVPQIVE